jgi:transcriptional regulator with XRE-family HTH domain
MDYAAFRKRIGRVIRERRQALKLKQAELADRLGTDQGNVSRLERGVQGFDSEILFKVRDALDIAWSEVFALVEGNWNGARAQAPEIRRLGTELANMAKEDRARYDAIRTLIDSDAPKSRK